MVYPTGTPMSIPIPEEILVKARQQEAILAQHGITEKTFEEEVEKKINEKGLSFVLAVYQTFEEFLGQEKKIFGVIPACKKGCSSCCYTLVTCTEMEMDEIVKYIKGMPRSIRRPLIREPQKMAIRWRNYYEKNELTLSANPFQTINDWQGKPCPFLNRKGGHCEIYPVRIIDCRTLTSLVPCDFSRMKTTIPCELLTEGPGRHRFRCESWATNLIMKRQQIRAKLTDPKLSFVTPVHHWLCIKKF
jgi:Fe-S-cluster containining protein